MLLEACGVEVAVLEGIHEVRALPHLGVEQVVLRELRQYLRTSRGSSRRACLKPGSAGAPPSAAGSLAVATGTG